MDVHSSGRAEIERIVRDAYAARKRNDLEACLRFFADRPVFRMAGAPVTSAVAMTGCNKTEMRKVLSELIRAFEWIDHTIVSIVIEGSKAAVQGRVKMEATATGDVVETDIADFIEVQDGRIVSFVEFCDTALAGRLMNAEKAV
jgi:ketosteroid isomerase-like protein